MKIHNRFSKTVKQKHRFIAKRNVFSFSIKHMFVRRTVRRFQLENIKHVHGLNHSEEMDNDFQRIIN